jgi:putative transposase
VSNGAVPQAGHVLAALPKSAHQAALAVIKDIYDAEDIDKAQIAIKAFEIDFGAKYPKAVANPIESTFATVRLRTKVTKGPGSRAAGITLAYKLIDAA